ncbi:Hypothetical protein Tpal_125 [Trichococcus palustris]|uniref:Prepilin type IV endopeptidase peptidase domain-containing protein n=1 Tax=Trichococcus palustris TaxID=140314 RepID=A0A143Y6S6_9LACT|nr:prepilin peptidase [Trichococcus palustris]CZQ80842.1 Hypothetical protein Tpal_125 [Trichococcus palustris]SFK63769.1 prepilin peptidase CpaA [Trichococcus palustris]
MALTNDIFLLILVMLSGFFDAKERKIPNKITFPGILIGILLNLFAGGWMGLIQSIGGLLVGLAIFFLPFVVGGMGAGDVKLMGAIGALMGWRFSLVTALYSALVGGFMVLVYLLYTGKLRDYIKKMVLSLIRFLFQLMNQLGYNEKIDHLQQRFVKNGQNYTKIYIPYGIAIAGGAVLVLIVYNQGIDIF